MLDPIVSAEDSAERLADLALGKLRSKIPQLQLALEGCIRDHHRFLLDSLLRQYRFLEAEIKSLDLRLEQLGEQHKELADAVARWITVPGVSGLLPGPLWPRSGRYGSVSKCSTLGQLGGMSWQP